MIELFGRFIRWFVRWIGGSTLFRLVLLALTLLSVGRGLIAVVGHIRPDWLPSTIVYAVLIGWLLGRARLPGWGSGLVAIGIGLVWLVLSVGNLSNSLDGLLPAFPPSTLIIDPGITSLVWGLALWLVSTWAAWWIRRREALVIGLLPGTLLLIYNVYYTNSKSGLLWLVLTGGGWIFLQAMDAYMKARRRWQAQHMGQTEIEPLLAGSIILLATGLMLAGGLIPSISIKKISDNFQHIFKSQPNKALAESLGLQQTPAVFLNTGSAGIGLSDTHAIGAGPRLSQEVLMYVSVDGYQPPLPASIALLTHSTQPDVLYYWRSQTYDTYNGHVWIANTNQTLELAANSPYHPGLTTLPDNYRLVRQHVTRLQPMSGALFVTGDLLSTDQVSVGAWRTPGDLTDARTNPNTFTADSRVQFVSADQLRTAGNKYPESVHSYLVLPDDLPARVRDLAVRLTINQPSPYDQVMAIQNYLRQFPYSLQVPGVPTNREVADYFLFDLQKGYCDYFATSMAVMVRAAGIPSRFVTGFSSGSYDYDTHRFVVEQANAHSWVEVYFPGIGWVEFEPTSNLPPFPRPGETAVQNTPSLGIPAPVQVAQSKTAQFNWSLLRQPLIILGWVSAGLILMLLLWQLLPFETWLLHLRPADQAIRTIHKRLYRQGHAWGLEANASRTPYEFAQAFSLRLERFTTNRRLSPVIVALQTDLNWLTSLYARLLFSQRPPSPEEHHQAVRIWLRIRQGLRKLRYS